MALAPGFRQNVVQSFENNIALPGFMYNGKSRIGVVVNAIVNDKVFKGKQADGSFRSFDIEKITVADVPH